ncbi:MAG TPA: glycosyl hydrolase 108 family protein [Planktothrix sp.]
MKNVLDVEKGLTLDPDDNGNWTGGAKGVGQLKGTNCGISCASYPNEDIKNMTPQRAKAIYKKNYWDKVRGDELPWKLAAPLFDAGVNEGTGTAIIQLQQALGVKADGGFGDETMAALKASDQDKVLKQFMANQLAYKKTLKNWWKYGEGWTNRINQTLADANKPPPTDTQGFPEVPDAVKE